MGGDIIDPVRCFSHATRERPAELENLRRDYSVLTTTAAFACDTVHALTAFSFPCLLPPSQSGRASPESSISSPPSSLHKVPFGGNNSAFVSMSDQSSGNNNENGSGNGSGKGSRNGGVAWRHDRVPIIASGIVSGPSGTPRRWKCFYPFLCSFTSIRSRLGHSIRLAGVFKAFRPPWTDPL